MTGLQEWLLWGAWGASMLATFLLWALGCGVALRFRPAPGSTFLAIGFGLLAFLKLMRGFETSEYLLAEFGILNRGVSPWNSELVEIGYVFVFSLLQFIGVALIVVGAMQSLRFAGRSSMN